VEARECSSRANYFILVSHLFFSTRSNGGVKMMISAAGAVIVVALINS